MTACSTSSAGLSTTELRAAVLDGELLTLGDGFAPLDLPVTSADRARTLTPTLGDRRVILADRTAAWVWGWCRESGPLSTCVSIAARIPSPERRRLGAREAVIEDDEWCLLDGVRVTTPSRTLIDLARHAPDASIVGVLATGLTDSGVTLGEVLAVLKSRPRLSFVRLARQRLAAASDLAAQPLLTR